MKTHHVEFATGYDRMEIELEGHFRQYTPGNWIEPVSLVAPIPYFSPDTMRIFMEAHKKGILESKLKELENSGKDSREQGEFKQLKDWYIKDTILDFFNEELYKSYEDEL